MQLILSFTAFKFQKISMLLSHMQLMSKILIALLANVLFPYPMETPLFWFQGGFREPFGFLMISRGIKYVYRETDRQTDRQKIG